MSKKSAKDIIFEYCEGRMSTRAEAYLGRGNNLGDLNPTLLQKIYKGVKTEISDSAAKSFVQMVGTLENDASASTFLTSLYRLEDSGWDFKKFRKVEDISEVFAEAAQRSVDDSSIAVLTMGMAMEFNRKQHDCGYSSLNIISGFLIEHQEELGRAPKLQGIVFPIEEDEEVPAIKADDFIGGFKI